jgi:hypothetical protein
MKMYLRYCPPDQHEYYSGSNGTNMPLKKMNVFFIVGLWAMQDLRFLNYIDLSGY